MKRKPIENVLPLTDDEKRYFTKWILDDCVKAIKEISIWEGHALLVHVSEDNEFFLDDFRAILWLSERFELFSEKT